jgi:excisionase family DNA binding protein
MKVHPKDNPRPFATVAEFASEFRVSDKTARELIRSGKVKAVRLGPHIIRIPRSEIERLATT